MVQRRENLIRSLPASPAASIQADHLPVNPGILVRHKVLLEHAIISKRQHRRGVRGSTIMVEVRLTRRGSSDPHSIFIGKN